MIGEEQEDTVPEVGITPQLPTSGQIIGALVTRLGITHPVLQKRTTRRYFAADMEHLVKETTRAEIIGAVAEVLTDTGFVATPQSRENDYKLGPALASILLWHAYDWDSAAVVRPPTDDERPAR